MQYAQAAINSIAISTLALTASSVFAVDYLTVAQAQAVLFPAAKSWKEQTAALSAEQIQAVAKIGNVNSRSANWKLLNALDDKGQYLGSMVVDNVIGKFELITYAVAIGAAGEVQGMEVLSYRESHGAEVRLPAWRKQFVGKTLAQPMKVGNDIAVISGATMSCNSITDGVRRITAVLSVMREGGLLPKSVPMS